EDDGVNVVRALTRHLNNQYLKMLGYHPFYGYKGK
ncbi:hypothetical protein HAINFHK1212_0834, partial [Haemophilus influenzae HK1212]